jgi:IS1 family transposase
MALGRRSQATTDVFIEGLRAATSAQQFQISTDGFQPYISAVTTTLSDRCEFAQVVKVYVQAPEEEHRRYSPPDVTHAEKVPIMGNPDPANICTSHVERANLTIRMCMRRLTRLTNAFSKKWENLWAAYCLHFAYYNFCRVHQTLRVTPAMEAGITSRVWNLADLLA